MLRSLRLLLIVFTATESGAIACLYALILTVFHYKELKISELPEILQKVAMTCGMVFFLVATSSAFGWIMAYEHIPQNIAAGISAITKEPLYVLMIVNVFILIVGFFMDMAASILILTPIFLPIAKCSLESTVKAILLFIPVLLVVLLLVTYVPAVTMTLPKMFMP